MRQFTQEILDKTLSENLNRRLDDLYYIFIPYSKHSQETLLKISLLWLNILHRQKSNIGKIL